MEIKFAHPLQYFSHSNVLDSEQFILLVLWHARVPELCITHELRNEIVEELIPHVVRENHTKQGARLTRTGRREG